MQILSKDRNDNQLTKLLVAVKKAYEDNAQTDKSLRIEAVTAAELKSFAGALFAAKALGDMYVVKPIAVPTKLETVVRKVGNHNNNGGVELPALPRDVVNSDAFRGVLKTAMSKRLGVAADKLIILPLVSTPTHLDTDDQNVVTEIFITLYNEIAIRIANQSKNMEDAKLSFQRDNDGNGQKLVVTANFGGSDEVDDFGKDVRSDILVSIGKPGKTNDDIGTSAESQYGKLSAYVDLIYRPVAVTNQTVEFGRQPETIPYLPRLVARQFEGPDGHNTIGHALFSLATLRAIYKEKLVAAYAYYPNYSLPKDTLDLRNLGALGADIPLSKDAKGNPVYEYIGLHAIKDSKIYLETFRKLVQADLRVGVSLRPFQMKGATQLTFMQAALGRTDAVKEIIRDAVTLTGGAKSVFPADDYANNKKQIFENNSITMKYAGEWFNPTTQRWEDLARLDTVAAFNLLCNDKAAGEEFQKLARDYSDLMLPQGNDQYKLAALWDVTKRIVGSPKNLRIDDYEFIPLFTKAFLDDLSNALNAVTQIEARIEAPHVIEDQQRGGSSYNFSTSGSFANTGNGGFGSGGGSTLSSDFSGFKSSW